MDARDLLAARAVPVAISPHSTSYFGGTRETLDPSIFEGERMRPTFRRQQLADVLGYLSRHFRNPERWATLWLAGSSASFQWSGTDPGDLDLLLGIDYMAFRRANPGFAVSDAEISGYLNRGFQSFNGRWGRYDRTLYSNPGATDIRAINPYAAYNLSDDGWTVPPDPEQAPPDSPELRAMAASFDARATAAVAGYSGALADYQGATGDSGRLNAAVRLRHSADVASALFDQLHHGRRAAFAPGGYGYADPANAAWQLSKASGAAQALKAIKDERDAVYANPEAQADRILIDAALYRRSR